ncbi:MULTISPECIES: hypothetical protein [unclassified Granulicatella]|uniref:hypothetical protein n=1 Tax=unclassified Granulicatella TaxID=2630493 RepID=UPI001073B967|nr:MULTISPECIES: hypothetical protein [unclassified Granulicatella]MBF0780237.1 hypothetical protein [Granulicatella sp. 19428wC4_WM01]TFU95671.1 hypothetical protein E4T68_03915 [Granulicatella sp. WM01]
MTKQKQLDDIENAHRLTMKTYRTAQETIHDLKYQISRETQDIVKAVYTWCKGSQTYEVQSLLNRITEHLDEMEKEYNRQLAQLEELIIQEKRQYMKKVQDIEESQDDDV